MTYIVGWKYKGNVYLTSDSAITRYTETKNITPSVVGEIPVSTSALSINEECYKLFQVEDDCIIAISGEVSPAIEFIKNIRLYSNKNNRESLLNTFCNSSRGKKFDAIIGLIVDNKPKLYIYRSDEIKYLEEKENYVCRGSGVPDLAVKTSNLIDSISSQKLYPTERLAFLVAGHQQFSINEDVFKKGVGGIFNGVRISKDGVQWNEDISYIFYSKNTIIDEELNEIKGDTFYVFAFNRELRLYVKSPFPLPYGIDKLIPNCEKDGLATNSQELVQWNEAYYMKIKNKIYESKIQTKYLSLIYKSRKDKYKVSLIKLNSKTLKKLHIKYRGEGWFDLNTNEETLKKLLLVDDNKDVDCVILKD